MSSDWDLKFFDYGEWDVIQERLDDLEKAKLTYNPRRQNLFLALDKTPPYAVKAVILGQDPYPDPKYATGLAFSVPEEIKHDDYPPTLKNILKEYRNDLGHKAPSSGSLEAWAERGVLLWNCTPSVTAGRPGSHRPWGEWELLTEEIITSLSSERSGIVFMLWGADAGRYRPLIDEEKHRVQRSSHPSPLGVNKTNRPFEGSRPFSTCNAFLLGMGTEPINWKLP